MRVPAQSEDEPIGWFEVEDDWNDVEIKLQQCRVAKVQTASTSNKDSFCSIFLYTFEPPYLTSVHLVPQPNIPQHCHVLII